MFSRQPVSMHPEDQRIVDIAHQLQDQLNYHRFDIRTVSWRERIGVRRFPPDFIFFYPHSLQLSTAVMGRLTPEEWKPLIASFLAYWKTHNRGMLRMLIPMASMLILLPALFFAGHDLLGLSTQSQLFILLVFIPPMSMPIISIVLFISLQKKLWLKADATAAQLVGREALVSSLQKLGSIDQSLLSRSRGFLRPSLQERIRQFSPDFAFWPSWQTGVSSK